MRLLKLVPEKTNIQFINKRLIAFCFSALLLVGSAGLFFGQGLNLGIDFLGGILIEVKTDGPANLAELRSDLNGLGLGEVSLQEFGAPDDVLIRIQKQEGGEKAQQAAIEKVKASLAGRVIEYLSLIHI